MDYPKFIVSNQKEESISIQRVNIEVLLFQVHEMEIARNQAERKLREHKGNVVEALIALTN